MNDAVAEQAALWVVRLQDPDCSPATRRAFEAWLAAAPAHRAEYEASAQVWQGLDRAAPTFARRRAGRRALLAVLVLAAMGGLFRVSLGFDQPFATARGERLQLELSDGTRLALNTDTQVVVRMGLWARTIRLERGEALFDVVPGRRGFEVDAAGATLTDIGTRFNVRAEAGQGALDVLEGAVQIAAGGERETFRAGQGARFDAAGVGPVAAARAHADAWLAGRWVFDATPLADVAAELDRYHARPTRVAPELAGLRVSGVFGTQDRAGLLRSLAALYPVEVVERDDATWVLPKQP